MKYNHCIIALQRRMPLHYPPLEGAQGEVDASNEQFTLLKK